MRAPLKNATVTIILSLLLTTIISFLFIINDVVIEIIHSLLLLLVNKI